MTDSATSFKDRRRFHHAGDVRLLGRSHVLDELVSVFEGRWPDEFGPVILQGKPGHGKTALVNSAAYIATQLGLEVVRARCVEGDQLHPGRLLSSIRGQLETFDLVRRLRDAPDDLDATGLAVLELLASRPPGTVLIAVDDAHWMDGESAEWLLDFCRHGRDHRVHMLITLQPGRPGAHATALDRLLFEHNARQFTLEPLAVDDVRTMLNRRLGRLTEPGVAEELHAATGGVPLLVVLAMNDWMVPDDDGRLRYAPHPSANPSVVRWILTRIDALPTTAYSLLESVAVLGADVDFRVAAGAASLDSTEAAHISDQLADLDILRTERPLDFTYEILRSSVYSDIPVERRSEIHELAARLLSARGNAQLAASHLLDAEPASNAWAAHTLIDAAQESVHSGDFERAEQYADRAVAESVGTPTPPELSLVLALLAAEREDSAVVEHIEAAIEHEADVREVAATTLELVDRLWEAPVRSRLLGALSEIRDELRTADPGLFLQLDLVESLAEGRPLDPAIAAVAQPTVMGGSTSLTDLRRVAVALTAVQSFALESGSTFVETMAIVRDNLTIDTVARGGGRWSATAVARVLTALVRMGAIDDAAPLIKVAHHTAMRDGHDVVALQLGLLLAETSTMRGQLDEAEDALAGVISHAPPGSPWSHLAHIVHALLLALQGASIDDLDMSDGFDADDWRVLGMLDGSHAAEQTGWLHLVERRWRAALDDFTQAELLAAASGFDGPATTAWRVGRVEALVALDELKAAHDVAARDLELARELGAPVPIARGLRALARTLPPDERVAPLEEAVQLVDPVSNVVDMCSTMIDLGRAYRDTGDTFTARTMLRDAADVAVRIGAGSLVGAATEELHATGARPRRPHASGSDSLTPAERRVVQLANEGNTNSVIASTLFISMKTVESHLARAYRKLGIKSRAELAGVFDVDADSDDPI